MRNHSLRIALAIAASITLLSVNALAGVKTRTVSFDTDMTIGGTLVKKGKYQVSFDQDSNELTIIQSGKVVARTKAAVEEVARAGKYKPSYTSFLAKDKSEHLTAVDLGDGYAVVKDEKVAALRAAAAAGQ